MKKRHHPVRVLAVNDYDLNHACEKVQQNIPVRHHLWGIHELQQDERFDVKILPYSHWPFLNRLSGTRTGDIDQQLRLFLNWSYDVVYAANYNVVMGLGLLRRLKLFTPPIVVAAFTTPPGGRLTRMMLEGFSHITCLSSLQALALRSDYPEISNHISHCSWGWDTRVQPASQSSCSGLVLSSGKTMRDYPTFIEAVRATHVPAKIVCPREYLRIEGISIPENCDLVSGHETWALEDNDMSDLIRSSAVIAIPLDMQEKQPHGLTSLLEAMAHAKPVLMTYNPYIDIDIEKIGCGYWIKPGSVDGWIEAINKVTRDPQLAAQMGSKGRRELEKAYSIEQFSSHIANVILGVV
jgi:hypothetical protein